MNTEAIIQAWKDPEFRSSLSAEERALLPDNPAGTLELSDEFLDDVNGGTCRGWADSAMWAARVAVTAMTASFVNGCGSSEAECGGIPISA